MSRNRDHAPVDSRNVPGNPLWAYRLSMLARGLVPDDETGTTEMRPDGNGWLTYSVVSRRRNTSLVPASAALAVIVGLLALAILLLG